MAEQTRQVQVHRQSVGRLDQHHHACDAHAARDERDVRGHARHAELVEVAERVDDVNQGLALPRAEGLGGRRPSR